MHAFIVKNRKDHSHAPFPRSEAFFNHTANKSHFTTWSDELVCGSGGSLENLVS